MINISIVITNYNRANYIDRAIRSCLNQLLFRKSHEVIVVDDASTDDSLYVIKEFSDDIKLFSLSKNKGVAYASNIGLKNASGKYFIRVDADDYLSNYACEVMSSILDHNPEIGFVYADHYRIDTKGFKQSKVRLDCQKNIYDHGAGILMRTDILKTLGGYDETLINCEDYDLLLRIKKGGYKGFYLPIPLYRYYIHDSNISAHHSRKEFRKVVNIKHGI